MDNNNPTPIPNLTPPPTNPVQTPPNPTPTTPIPPLVEKGSNNKMVLWLVLGIILLGILAGGGYWFLNQQQDLSSAKENYNQPVTQKEDLEAELDSIDVKGAEAEFTSVDKDLQSL